MASKDTTKPLPRFVVLLHEMQPRDGRGTHWDFMLEDDGSLATWALEFAPTLDATEIPCLRLPPHRKHYLDYEGPVSNDRGNVTQIDHGTFSWIERTTNRIVVRLDGKKLVGQIELVCADATDGAWTFVGNRELL